MGLLKNEVGRPTNKTIMIRNILKSVLIVVIVGGLLFGGYFVTKYFSQNQGKQDRAEKVDINKIGTRKIEIENIMGLDFYDVYYGNKKIIDSNKEILGIDNVLTFKDFAIFNLKLNDNAGGASLVIIDSNGNVIGRYDGKEYKNKNLTGKIYRGKYEIKGNEIYIYSDDDAQDSSVSCSRYEKGEASAYINVISYSKNEFVTPKLYKSISAKEVITDYDKQCGSTDINKNDEIANDLFSTMNSFDNNLDLLDSVYSGMRYLYSSFYLNDKTTNSEVNDKVKFGIIFAKYFFEEAKKEISYKFYLSDINKRSKELFGTEINVNNILTEDGKVDIGVYGMAFNYDRSDKSFNVSGGGIGDVSSGDIKTKITNITKNENKIEIVNKVMFIYSSMGEDSIKLEVFKTATDDYNEKFGLKNKITDLSKQANTSNLTAKDINIDDYLDKLDSYKWTFIKSESGNYIFSSVDKIK